MPHRKPQHYQQQISPPDLPGAGQLLAWDCLKLEDGETYSERSAVQLSFANQVVRGMKFDGLVLDHADASGTKFSGLTIVDSRLNQCDLANADWHGVQLRRVELIECRMTGFNAIEGKFRDCVFTNCNGSYLRARFASFSFIRFADCDLKEADFQGADLCGVDFARCDLRGAQMTGVKLKGASLRGCKIEGLSINAQDLDGVTVDPMQAAHLAPLFGIKVAW